MQTDRKVDNNHEGSIGNLMTDAIRASMEKQLNAFRFEHWQKKVEELVSTWNLNAGVSKSVPSTTKLWEQQVFQGYDQVLF